jgi:hypothetical protein
LKFSISSNPAPTDGFLCARAPASMAGTKDRVDAAEYFKTHPMAKPPLTKRHHSLSPKLCRARTCVTATHCCKSCCFDVHIRTRTPGAATNCEMTSPQIELQLTVSPTQEPQPPWQVRKTVYAVRSCHDAPKGKTHLTKRLSLRVTYTLPFKPPRGSHCTAARALLHESTSPRKHGILFQGNA